MGEQSGEAAPRRVPRGGPRRHGRAHPGLRHRREAHDHPAVERRGRLHALHARRDAARIGPLLPQVPQGPARRRARRPRRGRTCVWLRGGHHWCFQRPAAGPQHRAAHGRAVGLAGSTAASEETESTIDDEVAKLVDEAYATCKETLAQYRPLLDATVDALLEKETIDGFELDDLVEKYTGKPAPNPRPEAIAV